MRTKLVVAVVAVGLLASGLLAVRQLSKDDPAGEAELSSDGRSAGATTETVLSTCGTPGPDSGDDAATIPACLASGGGFLKSDFNADEITDLLVGVPFEDVGGVVDAGAVLVFYGGAGIATQVPEVFTQGSNGLADTPEANDQFGFAVTAVDLDCSGKADVAVGVPFEDVGPTVDAGAVQLIFGAVSGKPGRMSATPVAPAAPPSFWTQDTGTVEDSVEAGDLFGYSLSWGFLGTEARDQHLVVGAPGEDIGSIADAGGLHVLRNMCFPDVGLTDSGNQFWHQDSPGVADKAEAGDGFGTSAAIGLFLPQTTTAKPGTLVVGAPGEDHESKEGLTVVTVPDAGLVHLLPGAAIGVTGTGSRILRQGADGLPDKGESGDFFGEELLAKDVTSDSINDLVLGVPREDIESGSGNSADAGLIHVVAAAADGSGLAVTGSQIFDQAAALETVEAGDMFGASLTGLDRDAVTDSSSIFLAVGAPFEDLGRVRDAGAVHIFVPTAVGVDPAHVLTQTGAGETPEPGDRFGFSLGEWNYDGAGTPDLAVGAPGEDITIGQKVFQDAGVIILVRRPRQADAMASSPPPAPIAITQAGTPEGIEAGDQFGQAMY